MPEGRWPRGVTPRPRSGAAVESARLRRRRNGEEELPPVRRQGRWPGGATPLPHARGQGRRPGGPTPRPRSRGCVGAGGPRETIPR